MSKKVLIIGSGLGGISTALRLQKAGCDVTVVEKFHQPGGRLNQLQKDGFTFDMGPTFFSMSYEYHDFIRACDINPNIEFVSLDPLYTVNFKDNHAPYTIYKDLVKLANEFKKIEPDFEQKMNDYLRYAEKVFHDTEYRVIKKNFYSLFHYLISLTKVPLFHAPKMFTSFWKHMNKYFSSYEVKVIFSLVAFFLGNTPFDTPAVYSMLNYTELKHDGYHNVSGGMYRLVSELVKIAEQRGIKFNYHTEIVNYQSGQNGLTGFVDKKGNTWVADIYVVNADAAWFRGEVLQRKRFRKEKLNKMKWTLAPFTLYLGIKGKIPGIEHHNYYLGNNFKEYASKIFRNSVSLQNRYFYVNVPSRFNENTAPRGCESVFVLCPVPDLRYKDDWSDKEQLADIIIQTISQSSGYELEKNIISKTIYDPEDWMRIDRKSVV